MDHFLELKQEYDDDDEEDQMNVIEHYLLNSESDSEPQPKPQSEPEYHRPSFRIINTLSPEARNSWTRNVDYFIVNDVPVLPVLHGKFKCCLCNLSISGTTAISRHTLIHTQAKPFKCCLCNKQFRQNGTLTTHMRIHNNEFPYKCTYCKTSFRHQASFLRHYHHHCRSRRRAASVCTKPVVNDLLNKKSDK